MIPSTTRQIALGTVASLLAAGAVVTTILVSGPDATALGQLDARGRVAQQALEPIAAALAEERDARQAIEQAQARVTALRADLAAAEADLAAAQAALPAVLAKAAEARARWDRDVAGVALPEAFGRQVQGIGKAIRESAEVRAVELGDAAPGELEGSGKAEGSGGEVGEAVGP